MKKIKKAVSFLLALSSGVLAFGASACGNTPSEPIEPDNPPEYEKGLINNKYERDDVLIADIVCDKNNGYDVDETGVKPSTMAIQKAIDDCYALGGGTVYLPAGRYLVTARIDIKPYVSLIGDYALPEDGSGDYGTLILAGVNSTSADTGENYNLFRMQGCTSIIGLTFFYPEQYMDVVMPYAYAIEIPGGITNDMTRVYTVKNVTFINAYKGICASCTKYSTVNSVTHEQLHLENIRGTVLREGVHLTNSSEVGTFTGIDFSPKYWLEAGKKFNAPSDREQIVSYTGENSVGMILGDLEWQEISNINLEGYHTGMYFTDGDRNTDYEMAFIGSFYDLHISGSKYGIYVDKMYNYMGIQFCKAEIEGSLYSLINNSPETYGHIQLSGTTLTGKTAGPNIYWNNELYSEMQDNVIIKTEYKLPESKLFDVTAYGADITGKTDVSAAVQTALDEAKENGGGVVYMPAGFYRFEKPVTVYANTQLRGSASTVTRDLPKNSKGTLILSYYGSTVDADGGRALITLAGDNSGVMGLRIAYPEINMFSQVYTAETLPKYSFAIRGEGDGNYASNIYIEGAYNGIDFSKTNNCLIKKVMGAFWNIGYKIGGKNPVIQSCLQNAHCILQLTPTQIDDFAAWGTLEQRTALLHTNLYPVTRNTTKVLIMENAENAKISGMFSFAANTMITAENSTFTAINIGMDSQPGNNNTGIGAYFRLTNSTATVYNSLFDACSTEGTYIAPTGDVQFSVYNRITLLPAGPRISKSNILNGTERPMAKLNGDAAFSLGIISKA